MFSKKGNVHMSPMQFMVFWIFEGGLKIYEKQATVGKIFIIAPITVRKLIPNF